MAARSVEIVAALLSLALVIVGIDATVLQARVGQVALTPTMGAAGRTWLVVGSDSRTGLPPGAAQSSFGSSQQVAGARADIVLIVHRTANGVTSTLSVPRDLLVHNRSGQLNRLALAYQVSSQNLVDSLCVTFDISIDHVVVVDFAVFTAVVDALGGITVTLPAPVRDSFSGLDLPTAGRLRLDGDQALALVRSRHTEQYVHGRWTAVSDGPEQRTSWAGLMFSAIAQAAAASSDPVVLQRLGWTVSRSMQTDSGTSLADLAILAAGIGPVTDLPTAAVPGGLARAPSPQTYQVLAGAGFDRPCR